MTRTPLDKHSTFGHPDPALPGYGGEAFPANRGPGRISGAPDRNNPLKINGEPPEERRPGPRCPATGLDEISGGPQDSR